MPFAATPGWVVWHYGNGRGSGLFLFYSLQQFLCWFIRVILGDELAGKNAAGNSIGTKFS